MLIEELKMHFPEVDHHFCLRDTIGKQGEQVTDRFPAECGSAIFKVKKFEPLVAAISTLLHIICELRDTG